MTKDERKRFDAVVEMAQCLFLENIALKLVLEHRAVPNWQKLLDGLMEDEEIMGGVRLQFQDLYQKLGRTPEPSPAVDTLLRRKPRAGKPK